MLNRWGIHAPNNARPRNLGEFFEAGFHHYTVLHVNENLLSQIHERHPDAQILVRMYLTHWNDKDPADWAREIADLMSRNRAFTNQVTWANEQNLDIEGHPQGASPQQQIPPASLYQDINRWNREMIRRLREMLPWARLHYPAFANGHSDDRDQGGYIGLEICRPGIQAADVMDCHCYWSVEEGPLTSEGGQRFALAHARFPDKPIFISECGNFAVRDPRSPEQYVTWMHSLYHYPYVQGATFFIWDSDGAEENSPNVIANNPALVRTLRDTPKDAPMQLPPVPIVSPPVIIPVPTGGVDYLVQPGDTLLAIAKRFGIELVLLMNANSISDARMLRAGQRLRIPGAQMPTSPGGSPPPTPPGETTGSPAQPATPPLPAPMPGTAVYIVRPGDTLSAIARKFNVTVVALVASNNLANPNFLRVGQQLAIPTPAAVLSVAGALAVTESANPEVGVLGIGDAATPIVSPREIQEFLAGKRTTFYVARKGDTIQRIAALFRIDPLILAQINQVGQEGELIPGTRLIIPMK